MALMQVLSSTALLNLPKQMVLSRTGIFGIFLINYLPANVMMKSGLSCQTESILILSINYGVGLIKRLQRSRGRRRFHRSDSGGENVAKPKRPIGSAALAPCYMPLARHFCNQSAEATDGGGCSSLSFFSIYLLFKSTMLNNIGCAEDDDLPTRIECCLGSVEIV